MNAVLRAWATTISICSIVLLSASFTANAQFKVVGPPPFSPAVAREKVRALLAKVEPSNRQQTIATLSGLLAWYRDIIDEELIAAWRKNGRENLNEVVESLADARVATQVINFSWREQREAIFNLSDAPMLGHLMFRFPESAQPFLDDLFSRPAPVLTEAEAQAVCRILIDMPDLGTWRNSAMQILPHYRQAAESLIAQDARGADQERRYQALRWASDLKWEVAGMENEAPSPRTTTIRRPVRSPSPADDRPPRRERTATVLMPPPEADSGTESGAVASAHSSPPVHIPVPPPQPEPPTSIGSTPASSPHPASYEGPRSGTLESNGNPIPQNAEYVFRNLPAVKMQLDYDTKIWDARLVPGDGQTQRLILKNKSSGPQKRCVVHWSVIP